MSSPLSPLSGGMSLSPDVLSHLGVALVTAGAMVLLSPGTRLMTAGVIGAVAGGTTLALEYAGFHETPMLRYGATFGAVWAALFLISRASALEGGFVIAAVATGVLYGMDYFGISTPVFNPLQKPA